MPEQQFEGQSTNGLLQEALANAIDLAKESMHTDFVKWEIQKIFGESGGVVQVNILKVVIDAQPFSKIS